ncbi:metallophosphoesterase [Candidatus Woesearchaeota archaeon]|nr:metallophosphoesterase [Candidatus Woesearchaeota archaeon]
MSLLVKKKAIVDYCISKKMLVTKELLDQLDEPAVERIHAMLGDQPDPYGIAALLAQSPRQYPVQIVSNYVALSKKRDVQDFIAYFNARFATLSRHLQRRPELAGVTSIARCKSLQDKDHAALIGIVYEKRMSKNGNVLLKLEDASGTITVICHKARPVYEQANDACCDEVIGVTGTVSKGMLFANTMLLPEIPISNEMKKSPDEVYLVVLSDIHVGSKQFLGDEFNKFLQWIQGNHGTPTQRDIAGKVGYVAIVGDLVDGVGVYPKQEQELSIPDIYAQYEEVARLLSLIPEHIQLIISPGNHDAVRLAEPQPPFDKDFCRPMWELHNAHIISNPGMVRIHAREGFPGFLLLLYHGYSYPYYADTVDSIKRTGKGISDRSDLVMKYLLQRRHLAPAYGSTILVPDDKADPLVVDQIPDFFLSGHIHKASSSTYRNISLISGSCFQSKTSFQEKVGHSPEPGVVPVVNLRTRNVTLLDFRT